MLVTSGTTTAPGMHHRRTNCATAASSTVLAGTCVASSIILALIAALAAPPAGRRPRAARPTVWATVNVCDTQKQPEPDRHPRLDAGLTRTSRMYMRFRVQFQNDEGAGARSRAGRCGLRLGPRRGGAPRRARRRLELRVQAAGRPAARTSCAASCRSSGARQARGEARSRACTEAATPAPRAPSRPTSAPRPARSPERDQASNSRGSFVITPVTPSASSARIRARVVDRPHVEVAAGVAQRPHEPRRDELPVRHQRVAAAGAHVLGGDPGQPPARVAAAARRRAASVSGEAV